MKKKKIITTKTATCRVCRRTFETHHAGTKCCSPDCRNFLRQFKAHGVTADQIYALINEQQKGVCATCKGPLTGSKIVYGKNGELPAVLCRACIVKERSRKRAARPVPVRSVECSSTAEILAVLHG